MVVEQEPTPSESTTTKPPPQKDTTNPDQQQEEPTTIPPAEFLTDLHILPPLQSFSSSSIPSDTSHANLNYDHDSPTSIPLPPLRAEEPVSSLRAALSEVRGYAHMTHYRLVLLPDKEAASTGSDSGAVEAIADGVPTPPQPHDGPAPHSPPSSGKQHHHQNGKSRKAKKKHTKPSHSQNVISPYTGRTAVISIPHNAGGHTSKSSTNDIVLDDYGDLKPLLEKGLRSGSRFGMVLERYDAAGIRDHVTRLRNLLDGGAPYVVSLVEEPAPEEQPQDLGGVAGAGMGNKGEVEEKTKDSENDKGSDPSQDTSKITTAAEPITGTSAATTQTTENKATTTQPTTTPTSTTQLNPMFEKMQVTPTPDPLTPSVHDLTHFYSHAAGETPPSSPPSSNPSPRDPTLVDCAIRYGLFHPPTALRRGMGDLAYLEVTIPTSAAGGGGNVGDVIHVTATALGFYVNRTKEGGEFDPRPASENCFSHTLLDCLLTRSKSLRVAWAKALQHAKTHKSPNSTNPSTTPLQSLHMAATTPPYTAIDALLLTPSWLHHPTPSPYPSPHRAEDDLTFTHGVDLRAGAPRDWNEEFQSAREMPTGTLDERVERARTVHKILVDFGDAAVAGVLAIAEGHVAAMNPNEPLRSHVYLHNNIFFSRAVDAGVDTFKIARGDRAARKSAARDAGCMSTLHRLDVEGLHTLATVLVDYRGARIVCQSVVPGILHGERSHTLLYGAVEAGAPLVWDEEMHELLERAMGKGCMIATRRVFKRPLKKERVVEIRGELEAEFEEVKEEGAVTEDEKEGAVTEDEKEGDMLTICGPLEAKGIKGSDQRRYVLDVTRLTPRDANWIPAELGGTGCWEKVMEEETKGKKAAEKEKIDKYIPKSFDDDEWTMAVLRPELITSLTHRSMTEFLRKESDKENKSDNDQNKEKGDASSKDEASDAKKTDVNGDKSKTEDADKTKSDDTPQVKPTGTALELPPKNGTTDQDKPLSPLSTVPSPFLTKTTPLPPSPSTVSLSSSTEHLQSLRYNVNVLLPHTKPLPSTPQLATDEDRVREASTYLFSTLLPNITRELRESSGHQIPVDGNALTEFLHVRGVNVRYLGRLAQLARAEEAADGKDPTMRRTMPLCWLELLECEMVARAGKHVLDEYLTRDGGVLAQCPNVITACFLSAMVSVGEESAADTEKRLRRDIDEAGDAVKGGDSLEDDLAALAMVGGGGDAVPSHSSPFSRAEMWADVEAEIGRRYRYTLSQYNSKEGRGSLLPLLRRLCQRCGIQLISKHYQLGGKASLPSYPIAPEDIYSIHPLVKHSGAHGGEGFRPSLPPSLHILLPDAKSRFEAAHGAWTEGNLPRALDLAQEAAGLYQRATDTPLHTAVARCLDLTAVILFQAREVELAAANAARALAASVQLGGFDCGEAVAGHMTLAHILISGGGLKVAAKHLKAASYLMEVMGGKNYTDLASLYHKLGTMYHEVGSVNTALGYYELAGHKPVNDRMMESMIAKSTALVLASTGQFKQALDSERRAYGIYKSVLGEHHELTLNSGNSLKQFMTLAVEQGTRLVAEEKKRREEEAAQKSATRMVAEIEEEEEAKKKKKSKKKSKKKN